MKSSKLHFFALSILILTSNCVGEEPRIVPDVYVNISINLSLPAYDALNSINNSVKLVNYGYNGNGVIVYRLGFDEFLAFDATCPQHIETSTSVALDDNGAAGTATCPHCEVKYSFFNYGQAAKGYPLKRYNTSLSGNILRVTN